MFPIHRLGRRGHNAWTKLWRRLFEGLFNSVYWAEQRLSALPRDGGAMGGERPNHWPHLYGTVEKATERAPISRSSFRCAKPVASRRWYARNSIKRKWSVRNGFRLLFAPTQNDPRNAKIYYSPGQNGEFLSCEITTRGKRITECQKKSEESIAIE